MTEKRRIVKKAGCKAVFFVDTYKNTILSDLLKLGGEFQHSQPALQGLVHPGHVDFEFCSVHKNHNNIS